MGDRVSTSLDDGVLTIRLNRPEARNALDLPLAAELSDALAGDLAGVGAICLLAAGDHFCVGGDVRAMAAAEDRPAFVRQLADELHRGLKALPGLPPVVIGVRGWAAGAGMSLVLAGDVVVAADTASFQPAYPGIGATPDGGMTWNLPRAIGERRARALLVSNRAVPAAEALALGIVDELVPADDVDSTALAEARALAAGPTDAFRGAKRLLADARTRTFAEQLDAEAASISAAVGGAEGIEGVDAFVGRRTPDYSNR